MEYKIKDNAPMKASKDIFIAPSADVIGKVKLGTHVSIWFQAVIRADTDTITIGDNSNIQDGCIIHVDEGFPTIIGESVTVGHKAMLHGCSIDNNTLVGIGAIILNGAKIGKHCIIGAGTLITEGTVIPDYSLVIGTPGKIVKTVTEAQANMLTASAQHYVKAGEQYTQSLKALDSK